MPLFEHFFPEIYKTETDNTNNNDISNVSFKASFTNEITKQFKLPIEYIPQRVLMPTSIHTDLELMQNTIVSNEDVSGNLNTSVKEGMKTTTEAPQAPQPQPMYNYLLRPQNALSKQLIAKWGQYYTSDVEYLRETQEILNVSTLFPKEDRKFTSVEIDDILNIWTNVKTDEGFMDRYNYIDWKWFEHLNESSFFLDVMSIYNLSSPIISILTPVLIIIIPFFILKIKSIPITLKDYFEIVYEFAKSDFIGKTIISTWKNRTYTNFLYAFVTIIMYVLQVYQNSLCSYRFYNNIFKIHKELNTMNEFLKYNINKMRFFISPEVAGNKNSYCDFCRETAKHIHKLEQFQDELTEVFEGGVSPFFGRLGKMMKCYYLFYKRGVSGFEESIQYAMGFEGYMDNLCGIRENINEKHIHLGTFINSVDEGEEDLETKEGEEEEEFIQRPMFLQQYYPPTLPNPVKNDVELKKNIIITGPNASGKTTILKTTLLNVIFTQQIGFGYYEKCYLKPYTHIHSYLNIPDTSGRDSLFQAEARRCKDILISISTPPAMSKQKTNNDNYNLHFCIFDELFSGTNPTESSVVAEKFLFYLSEKYKKQVHFLITTHYKDICDKIMSRVEGGGGGAAGAATEDVSENVVEVKPKLPPVNIECFQMKVEENGKGKLKYTYQMIPGVSSILGAMRVLKDMDYPTEMID